jgi:arylsulfatase A-like enzyme
MKSLILSLLSACLAASAVARDGAPNIIFILADDLGWGDVGAFGQTKIKTPNLDGMAAEGMRFTDFYAGSAVCAPSRCTLMTGKHTGHTAVRDNAEKGAAIEGQQPMPKGTRTIASALKARGYATGIIGKWGLGMPEDGSGPNDCGFDYHFGYLCQRMAHTYFPPYLWRNTTKVMYEGNPPAPFDLTGAIPAEGKVYSHDEMAADSLRWVREHRDAPFFLYVAYTIPHLSQQVPEDSLAEYRGKWEETPYDGRTHYAAQATPRAAYAAMVSRMDRDIGRLMALLKELALDENTLVMFASDNGAMRGLCGLDVDFFKSNGPFRGGKQDLFEGGIRTPLIARWPGHVKAGAVSGHAGAFWDVAPTLCELTGAENLPDIDGISFLPTLLGTGRQEEHDHLYWEYHGGGGALAVRMGKWKALRRGVKKNPDAPVEIYDLASDESESSDVAAQHPDLVAKARELFEKSRTVSPVKRWNF